MAVSTGALLVYSRLSDIIYMSIITLIFAVLYHEFNKRRSIKNISAEVPKVFGLPFFGVAYKFFPLKKLIYSLDTYFKNLNSYTFYTWWGKEPILFTADPDIVKVVLTSDGFLTKANVLYESARHALPNGLLTSAVPKWKNNRRLLNPIFKHRILNSFIPTFYKGMQNIVSLFDGLSHKKEEYVFESLKHSIALVTIESLLDTVLDSTDTKVIKSLDFVFERITQDMIFSRVGLSFVTRTSKYYETLAYLKNYVHNLMITRQEEKERLKGGSEPVGKADDNEVIDDKTEYEGDYFIDQVFGLYKRGLFKQEDVITEAQTLLVASYETLATTLYSVLVMLSMHGEAQERLFRDTLSILPTKESTVEYDDLKKIPYLDMVIEETLRLLPSVPLIGRQCGETKQMKDDFYLPAGTSVGIFAYTLHRRKDLWGEDAEEFNPDHFLPENVSQRHPFAYIPFSKGQRNCIGLRYAEIAMKVFLLGLVRNFKFSTTFKYKDLVLVEHLSLGYDVQPKLLIQRRD